MMRRPGPLLTLASVLLTAAVLYRGASPRGPNAPAEGAAVLSGPGDYDRELAQLDAGSADEPALSAYRRLRRASLTRAADDFLAADLAADAALRETGPTEDVCLLKAQIDLWFHRLPQAAADLAMVRGLSNTPPGRVLLADVDMQAGDYRRARATYEGTLAERRTWDGLARLAHLISLTDDAAADRLYAEAQAELTAKEMRAYAWVELQRGLLHFNRGRHEQALAHYRRADRAYSGYWLAHEHIAEVLAARGEFPDAISLYRRVVERSPRPETWQTMGDLYASAGEPGLAAPWHEKALAGYSESAGRGEVHYYHHLASYFADVRQEGSEAVKWAYRDLELRKNHAAYDALAWALYRAGRFDEALDAMGKCLAFGERDAHLFFHAAMINLAAGRADEGKRLLAEAAGINPHYTSFHVHR